MSDVDIYIFIRDTKYEGSTALISEISVEIELHGTCTTVEEEKNESEM